MAVRGEIGRVARRRRDAERHAGRRRLDDRRNSLGVVRIGDVLERLEMFILLRPLLLVRSARLSKDLLRGAERDASREFRQERGLRGDGVELEEGHERRVRGFRGGPPK